MTLLRGAARSTDSGRGRGPGRRRCATSSPPPAGAPTPPSGTGAARERWESLAALVRLAEELAAAAPAAAMADLVAEIEQRQAAQHAPPVDGVTLASLHAAKGLEWDAVFLVGLADGTMPIVHAETPEQVEEERRLLYVGVTRAREHLWLSWALARSPGGARYRKPSRFLDGLLPASLRRPAAGRAHHRARVLAQAGGHRRLPGLRPGARRRRRAQARPLRGLPVRPRRGTVRAASRVAAGPVQGAVAAGLRRFHRRHARPPSPRPSPVRWPSSWRSPAWASASSTSSAPRCSRWSPTRASSGLPSRDVASAQRDRRDYGQCPRDDADDDDRRPSGVQEVLDLPSSREPSRTWSS